jgi:DNA-binding NarL/FixJ family response regulator
MTRILIADDHEVVRSGLRSIIEAQPRWEVVGEAVDGKDAVRKAVDLKPDVASAQSTSEMPNTAQILRMRLGKSASCGSVGRTIVAR